MPDRTDLSQELHHLCAKLIHVGNVNESTDAVLANVFNVEPWSSEFFEIVFIVTDKIELLIKILSSEYYEKKLNALSRPKYINNLNLIKSMFDKNGIYSNWNSIIVNILTENTIDSVLAVSDSLNDSDKIFKLTHSEIFSLISMSDKIKSQLLKMENSKNKFFVDSIMVGLEKFLFRLDRIGYLGIVSTLESFSELLKQIIILENICTNSSENLIFDRNVIEKISTTFKGMAQLLIKGKEVGETVIFYSMVISFLASLNSNGNVEKLDNSDTKLIAHYQPVPPSDEID
jgi:hypothetical protein